MLEGALSKARTFSAEASTDLAHNLSGGGGNVEKYYFHNGALLAELMDHPDLAAHFALNAPQPWLKLMGELDEYYENLLDLVYEMANLGKKTKMRVQAERHAAGKPTFDYFSSKQDGARLDRFVEYWTALPQNLHPTALRGFLYSHDWCCCETEMAE